jgi:anionic cell wall polymer biosynthesis LytR-Cps2A-Psr (LCP) family protein
LRKLCIAVIAFSFLGFGPLKSFFQNDVKTDGNQISGDNSKVETFLITENEINNNSSRPNLAIIISRDAAKNKLSYGTVQIPPFNDEGDFSTLKKTVEKNYHIPIDYCFIIDSSGAARILDLLAPNGITSPLATDHDVSDPEVLKGKEMVDLLNQLRELPNSEDYLVGVISAIRSEVNKNLSADQWLTMFPALLNEARHSVKTDIAKGELLEIGLSAIMNPITKFELIHMNEEQSKAVNGVFEDKDQKPMIN